MNHNIIFRQILESCKKKSLVEEFIFFKMQRLQEMGHNTSLATARNYISFAEKMRKQKINIWDEKVIDEIVIKVIEKGWGTDHTFLFNLTPQEKKSQNLSEAWIENVVSYIRNGLFDVAPNEEVFKTIENKFKGHLHRN
jgi:hypothetical protein